MTFRSQMWYLCGIVLYTSLSVSGQPTSQPNNILQYKNQQDQHPYRQGYFPGPNHYQGTTKLNPQQSSQHDFSKTRNIVYADEPKQHPQPVEITASQNHQPMYYPLHSNHKDTAFADNAAITNKLQNLANVLSRNPRPDAARNHEPVASASEIHEQICAPPKPNPPSVTPQAVPQSPPLNPPCSRNQNQPQPLPPTTPKPQCSQTKATPNPPYPQPKPEPNNLEPPRPAPKFAPSNNPFQSDSPERSPKPNFISVSPLHPSSKHPDVPSPEPPCASPPCPRKTTYEYEVMDESARKQIVPIIPAAKPIVYNPFSENKNEQIVPLPTPKGVLHHRQNVDEVVGYPERYVSKPETPSLIPQAPYYFYPSQFQTVAGNPYIHALYPYVPSPITKPIPLVVPASEVDEEESEEVSYPAREYLHVERPSRRYGDDWSKDVLRDIADKLGAILDDDYDFRSRRLPSRAYPDERGYYDGYERPEDEPGTRARSYRDYFEEDYDNNRRKERKYSRAG